MGTISGLGGFSEYFRFDFRVPESERRAERRKYRYRFLARASSMPKSRRRLQRARRPRKVRPCRLWTRTIWRVKDVIQLPENLAGKSIFSSDYNTLYTISDSGVLVMPVGSLSKTHRVVSSQADVIFRGNICNQQTATQVITISDLGWWKYGLCSDHDHAGRHAFRRLRALLRRR